MNNKKITQALKISTLSAFATLAIAGGAFAQTAEETPTDELITEVTKVENVFDSVKGPAIGAAVFSVGMILIKRIAFS